MGHDLATDDGWTAALDALVEELQETRRAIATLEARQEQLLSDAVDLALTRASLRDVAGRRTSRSDLAIREVAAELGAAMRVTDRTVQARMGSASTLTMRFPATLSAWRDGRIDGAHARVILDAGDVIEDDDARARFEQAVLPVAEQEAPGRLRAMARTVAAHLDPSASSERQRRATAGRRVRLMDLDDGMARLVADLPAPLAYAIRDRLDEMACVIRHDEGRAAEESAARRGVDGAAVHASGQAPPPRPGPATAVTEASSTPAASSAVDSARGREGSTGDHGIAPMCVTTPGRSGAAPERDVTGSRAAERDVTGSRAAWPTRTMDQIRADALADLLLAGVPAAHGEGDALAAITGRIQITVPALTAAGTGPEPFLLAGYGPIDGDIARRLAGLADGWDRVLTHPGSGAVLSVDRYRPDERLKRHLRARDEHCRAPGCRRAAVRCDVDHTVDAASGGPTRASNLAHVCRRHHVLKHQTAWRVEQKPGGVLEWYSPTGRRYEDRPPSTVRFIPTEWSARAASSPAAASPPPPF